MTYVRMDRKVELLYANGEKDPRMCELEIELYNQSRAEPGVYLGYYKGESRTIKKVVDLKQAEEIAAELLKSDDSIVELVVVDVVEGRKDHLHLLSR
jgi:hypothetical protein